MTHLDDLNLNKLVAFLFFFKLTMRVVNYESNEAIDEALSFLEKN